jgi:hypothetical protein
MARGRLLAPRDRMVSDHLTQQPERARRLEMRKWVISRGPPLSSPKNAKAVQLTLKVARSLYPAGERRVRQPRFTDRSEQSRKTSPVLGPRTTYRESDLPGFWSGLISLYQENFSIELEV